MFCPLCKAEYRQGITLCLDCNVALVPELPRIPGETSGDPFCSFWKGSSMREHAEIRAVLDREAIPHKTVFREDHFFNLPARPPFEIGVPASLFEKARMVVSEALGWNQDAEQQEESVLNSDENTAEMELPIRDEFAQPQLCWDPDAWNPEDATVEVWSGDDPNLADFIRLSLRENQIHCRLLAKTPETGDGPSRLYVLPADEPRAREILRQISDASPAA
jgi:hypothetical protein